MSIKVESIIMEINKEAWELLINRLDRIENNLMQYLNRCDSCRNTSAVNKINEDMKIINKSLDTDKGTLKASHYIIGAIVTFILFIIAQLPSWVNLFK